MEKILAWWSGGVTSAVACKLALEKYSNVSIVFIETGSHHSDLYRFKKDCEKWYNQEILTIQSTKYTSVIDVILSTKFVNGPFGARCTLELKKEVRKKFTRDDKFDGSIWGFEYTNHEIDRAKRLLLDKTINNPLFPLIENKLNKKECVGLLKRENINIPQMYKLGYNNNNCIGCVKGGAGYWNKIRIDFPEIFNQMMLAEIEINASCLKGTFLHSLDPKAGRKSDIILPECGFFCQQTKFN